MTLKGREGKNPPAITHPLIFFPIQKSLPLYFKRNSSIIQSMQIWNDNQCSLLKIWKQNCNINFFLVFVVELRHALPLRTIPISTRTMVFITLNFYSVTLICIQVGAARSEGKVQAVAGVGKSTRQSEQKEGNWKIQAVEGLQMITISTYPHSHE